MYCRTFPSHQSVTTRGKKMRQILADTLPASVEAIDGDV